MKDIMIIEYCKKRNAKFMSYPDFPGFDKINEDIVMTWPDGLTYDTLFQAIKYITNINNRDEIDRIRLNGYNFYREYKLRMDRQIEEIFKDLV
jgi:hypothetical protein